MKKGLLALLLFITPLHASWDPNAVDEGDPTLFHNVNVLSGQFTMRMDDVQVRAAHPLNLFRTYSSAGILELDTESERKIRKKGIGTWFVQGGWALVPQTNLVAYEGELVRTRIFLPEPSGTLLQYEYNSTIDAYVTQPNTYSHAGTTSARTDPGRRRLMQTSNTKFVLYFPDGGKRVYKRKKTSLTRKIWLRINAESGEGYFYHYLLQEEVLPSGHVLVYTYRDEEKIRKIALFNPSRTKELAHLVFRYSSFSSGEYADRVNITASDGQTVTYALKKIEGRHYYGYAQVNGEEQERCYYEPVKNKEIPRVHKVDLHKKPHYELTYYTSGSKLKKRKVKEIRAPGLAGEMVSIGKLTYTQEGTEVRDANGLLTKYIHDGRKLSRVEYYNQEGELHSTLKFLWERGKLRGKILLDEEGGAIHSKTFAYDAHGNLIEEVLYGSITGRAPPPFILKPDGSLEGADSYKRTSEYDPETHHLLVEKQESGPTFRYEYKKGTDLLTAKHTLTGDRVQFSELSEYDEDHLLIREIQQTQEAGCLTRIIHRDPRTCMPIRIEEDALGASEYTYNNKKQVTAKTVYDAKGNERYTLHFTYNYQGRLIHRTTPASNQETFTYMPGGKLLECKEEGKPHKAFTYDARGFPISCIEGGLHTTTNTYDIKGRLLQQTDPLGRSTYQAYDSFGNCIETKFLKATDDLGFTYIPTVRYTHDHVGNLTSTTTDAGTTQTIYNVFRKPTRVTQPDGTVTAYTYNTNGTLALTTLPDGSTISQTYDLLLNPIQKTHSSPSEKILSEEAWTYQGPLLTSYTDPRGLTVQYTYDHLCRKIQETALDRTIRYTYDSLGNLERTICPHETKVEKHSAAGLVVEQWIEGPDIEEHIQKTYDEENRLIRAITRTGVGEAIDTFTYDSLNRLTSHTDPLGSTTHYHYNETSTDIFDQKILEKTTIDPLGNIATEVYDANGRLDTLYKQSPTGQFVSKTKTYHDRVGNKTREDHLRFRGTHAQNTITHVRTYDSCGRLLTETEAGLKTTRRAYNVLGQLVEKHLPNGTTLHYAYDSINRLLSLQSTDDTVHYTYTYDQGPDPIYIEDHIAGTTHTRTHDPFGQLLTETTPNNLTYTYTYDASGRCTSLILPDHTPITYTYTGRHLTAISRPTYTHTYDAFDPLGRPTRETNILGTVHTTARDLLDRPTLHTTPWHAEHITYNALSLPTSINNTLLRPKTYTYDPLHQLKTENAYTYNFDSLGNPPQPVNDLNQFVDETYDPNGNLTSNSQTYDALGRLTSTSDHTFTYDSFGRLLTIDNDQLLYLNSIEIGTHKKTLKVQAPDHSPIALELNGTTYLPLSDQRQNIIALITTASTVYETYDTDAFGRGDTPTTSPWRFASKLALSDLIYFGHRFYIPSQGRWLTPDPAGPTDGPNLYLYVQNSPTSRLDRFGLIGVEFKGVVAGEDAGTVRATAYNRPARLARTPLRVKSSTSTIHNVDRVLAGLDLHRLTYEPEQETHTQTLDENPIPKEGTIISCITYVNGINTSPEEFEENCTLIRNLNPGVPFIGYYNRTNGLRCDLGRATLITLHYNHENVAQFRQRLVPLLETIHRINENALIIIIAHSEGGALFVRAVETMVDKNQELARRHFIFLGLGPLLPASTRHARIAVNYYSVLDPVTSRPKYFLDPKYRNYDIRLLKCSSTWDQMTLPLVDHAFRGNTYQGATRKTIDKWKDDFGFYTPKVP